MCELTPDMDDSIRISNKKLPLKEYITRMKEFVKTRINKKLPDMVMPMYTPERPAPKVNFLN